MPWWGWTIVGVLAGAYLLVGAFMFFAELGLSHSFPHAILAGVLWPFFIE